MSKIASIKELATCIHEQKNADPRFVVFIGAGASASSGIPVASAMTSNLLREIYNMENGGENADMDTIRKWCDTQEWWTRNPTESDYSRAFRKRYRTPAERRDYIEKVMKDASPALTYVCLANLLAKEVFRIVFTTNFDDLLNDACIGYNLCKPVVCAHDLIVDSIPSRSPRPQIVKLHGDFLYDNLSNLDDEETGRLTKSMEKLLRKHASECGFIFVGYGGGDNSVMGILEELVKAGESFRYGVYWATRNPERLPDRVKNFLARQDEFRIVKSADSDTFFAELQSELRLPVPELFIHALDRPISLLKGLRPSESKAEVSPTVKRFTEEFIKQLDALQKDPAVSQFMSDTSRDELNIEEALLKAWAESGKKDYAAAIGLLEPLQAEFPEHPDINFALATMLSLQGQEDGKKEDLERALPHYELAVKHREDYREAYDYWGTTLLSLGKMKGTKKLISEALEKLSVAEEIKPGFGSYNMACAYSLLGESKEAVSWLKKAIKYYEEHRAQAKSDEDFENVRDLPEFKKLLKKPAPKKKSKKKK